MVPCSGLKLRNICILTLHTTLVANKDKGRVFQHLDKLSRKQVRQVCSCTKFSSTVILDLSPFTKNAESAEMMVVFLPHRHK